MVTPLMLLLLCLDENLHYDKSPLDLSYLSRPDRTLIVSEAMRLGRLANDPDVILMTEDRFGNPMVDPEPFVNGRFIKLSYPTTIILEHIREAANIFSKGFSEVAPTEDVVDLSEDNIVLRIEGNPKFVYVLVKDIMEAKGISYREKIDKLASIYRTIENSSGVDTNASNHKLVARMELQSTLAFWQRVVLAGMTRHDLGEVVVITEKDIACIKKELQDLGFYGFVNPLAMYNDFASSRITRKVNVNIDEEAKTFLHKVILSGGAA